MSFRKRNVGLSSNSAVTGSLPAAPAKNDPLPGVRPSAIDGRSVTSTGTSTLDGLLAGHGGLALGCSLLIEEDGTTDYAGALLKFFAAEGLLQGHHVHVVGLPEQWARGLPGTVDGTDTKDRQDGASGKMKIAWRYESLGQFGQTSGSRDDRPKEMGVQQAQPITQGTTFCHTFDLTKRLAHPSDSNLSFHPLSPSPTQSPLTSVIASLRSSLSKSQANTVHRFILPSLLSPLLYSPHSSQPEHLLSFLHDLRSLMSTVNAVVLATLPLSLHPRTSGLTRWIELLHDGVLELAPFPHTSSSVPAGGRSEGNLEEPPQGLLRVHKLPVLAERGSGMRRDGDDWTFSLSRRRFRIEPYHLPPIEGDQDGQASGTSGGGSGDHQAAQKSTEF